MLFVNCFRDGGVLLESTPQGDASIPVKLSEADALAVQALLTSPEASAALARLFLAGVTAGERSVSRSAPARPDVVLFR